MVFVNENRLEAFETSTGKPVWTSKLESDDCQSISTVGQKTLKVEFDSQADSEETKEVFYNIETGKLLADNNVSGMILETDLNAESKENFVKIIRDGKQIWRYKTRKITGLEDSTNTKTEVSLAQAKYDINCVILNYLYHLPANFIVWDETVCLDAFTGKELWSFKTFTRNQAWNEKYFVCQDNSRLVVRDIKTGKIVSIAQLDVYRDAKGMAINNDSIYIAYCPENVTTYDKYALHCYKVTE